MSVRAMAKVWELSSHSSRELLMLLAIADFADDDGRAYPAIGTLAKKCRMSSRNAMRILASLRNSGELQIGVNAGPRGCNTYRVLFAGMKREEPATPLTRASPLTRVSPLTDSSGRGDIQGRLPLTPVSPEPSGTTKEPSRGKARAKKPAIPPCPHRQIIELYDQILPEWPRVKSLGTKRQALIAKLWEFVFTEPRLKTGTPRATDAEQAIDWIRTFLTLVRSNGNLMTCAQRPPDSDKWRATFDHLCTEKGRNDVLETEPSQYESREVAL